MADSPSTPPLSGDSPQADREEYHALGGIVHSDGPDPAPTGGIPPFHPGEGHSDHRSAVVRADPGLEEHIPRRLDIDARLARRAERQVAAWFTLSALSTVLFVVAYFALRPDGNQTRLGYLNWALGGFMGLALFGLGAGLVHWAKKLMPDEEMVQERHDLRSSDADRAATTETILSGVEAAGIGRRSLIRRSLIGAGALLAMPPLVLLRDLGPLPDRKLYHTAWKAGLRIVTDPGGNPVRPEDIPIGGVVHVLPEGILPPLKPPTLPPNTAPPQEIGPEMEPAGGQDRATLAEMGKAAVLLIRLRPEDIKTQQGPGWDYQGIVAFSKVCTHVGCPVGLYEHTTHHLLCPCHQSTFDVSHGAKVVFGPAARPLPQLAITVDQDGYLVAKQGFTQPVGPSFWERG